MIVKTLLLSAVGLLITSITRLLHRYIWKPLEIKRKMEAQGIRGPPYRFLHGNAKEAAAMVRESLSRPMELSHDIFPRVQPHLHTWIKQYGKSFLKWHGPSGELIVNEPELIKEILNNQEGAYIKQAKPSYATKLLGDGLVTTEGAKWVRQRKLANRAFRAENLRDMIPEIVISVEVMLNKWRVYEGKEIDLFEEFQALATDVIARTVFGSSYIQGQSIFKKLEELATIVSRNLETVRIPFKILQSSDDIKADKLEMEIREIIQQLIMEREESNPTRSDFFGSLVKAYHETDKNERISLEDVIDECKTFYFAGEETTAGVLTWTALLLSTNTEWQDKARKEIVDLFGHRTPISGDTGIGKMKTMTMIINESLRLYPPVVWLHRTVAKEVKLGDVLVLPPGIDVVMPSLHIHHDPELWGNDAHLFKPERFSEGVARATKNTAAFVPFGMGPRFCVGQGLAMMEVKLVFSMILQRYSLALSPGYVHSPMRLITVRPQHGLQVILQRL